MTAERRDDWIEWAGTSKEGPALPDDAVCEYLFRDGDVLRGKDSTDRPWWCHKFGEADVVAYRVVSA